MNKDIKIPDWGRKLVGFAIKDLGDAVTCDYDGVGRSYEIINSVERAQHHLTEFFGLLKKTPELSDDEAELCRCLHTYMRKCMDSHTGSMLYNFIHEDYSPFVWYSFVKGLIANDFDFREALEDVETQIRDVGENNDRAFLHLLWIWFEHENGQSDVDEVKNNQ